MLSGPTNILDQLLGGFEAKPFDVTGNGGQGIGSDAAGIMFGELLAGLMQGGQLAVDPNTAQLSACLFPSSDQPVAQDGAPAGQSSGDQSLIGQAAVQAAANQPFMLFAAASTINPLTDALAPKISSEAIANPNASGDLKSLNGATPNTNAPVYNIVDFQVQGGMVELTAVTADQPTKPVTVSIPTAVLAEAINEKIAKLSGVDNQDGKTPATLKSAVTNSANLDVLLKASNLKTLTVVQNSIQLPVAAVNTSDSVAPVAVTIVADNGGVKLALTAKMTRQELTIRSKNDSNLDLDAGLTDAPSQPEEIVGLSPARKEAENLELLPLKRSLAADKFSLPAQSGLDARTLASQVDLTGVGQSLDRSTTDSASARTTATPIVKFTLPDTISKPFAANGHSIMIKIEPEHLGPARLNLSVRDQMLTARVTVDTPAAKMAVERSLDQLTEQLSRSGIDVDKIDVMLGDRGAREQFMERRPQWSHTQDNRKDQEIEPSNISPVMTATMLSRQYVGHSGVNVLA